MKINNKLFVLNLLFAFPVFVYLIFFPSSYIFAAGGVCTFSDNCSGATTFNWCSPVLAGNSSCSVSANCLANDNTADCGPSWPTIDFGFTDECDLACKGISCPGGPQTYTDASGECACAVTVTLMGAICSFSATQSDPLCGSIENTSYTRLCIPATYIGSCAHTFSVTGISCSGGGASLQWALYPATTTCANILTANNNGAGTLIPCENGSIANYSTPVTLAPGSCYLLLFDGNNQAACSWSFNMTAPTPTVAFTQSAVTACTGACVTFTNTSNCYNTNNVTWTATDLANQTSNNASFCWATAGVKTISLTVGSGIGSCATTATISATVTVSVCCTQPTITLVTQTNVLCNGGATGALDINVTGALAPYTYAWSSGPTTQDISGLIAGAYTVTVTETNLCTATATWTITQNPLLVITPTLVTNVLCPCESTGAINITVTGGVSPYTYAWSSGQTTEDLTGIPGGVSYTVTVTDSKACTKTYSTAITVPPAIAITLVSSVNPTCNGACNGSATFSTSGGTSPYDYSNDGGAVWDILNTAVNYTYSALCTGPITVTVRDANGCITPP